MKPHKWHKEIKAWADGAEIEIKYFDEQSNQSEWFLDENPDWNKYYCEYRIKPQPKEPQYLYVYRGGLGSTIVLSEYSPDSGRVNIRDFSYIRKIKLENDDE